MKADSTKLSLKVVVSSGISCLRDDMACFLGLYSHKTVTLTLIKLQFLIRIIMSIVMNAALLKPNSLPLI